MEQHECPICYEKIENDTNVSISPCKHTFHTSCLLSCGSTCPMCRRNMIYNITSRNRLYTHNEYKQFMKENSISYDMLSPTMKRWLDECEEYYNWLAELNEIRKKNKENEKSMLKKHNPDKYKLFYSST
jgi:hypothetical protein